MIDIAMVGLDHDSASIDDRELFAFNVSQTEQLIRQWKKDGENSGCLLLSTCNRTELWLVGRHSREELIGLLCHAKELDSDRYENLFTHRTGTDAVTHLLRLTCGLKSMIRGEDQILSQVREALDISRACNTADTLIEKLFQTAISVGKKVKTRVKINYSDPSLAKNIINLIQEKFGTAENIRCLIVGNGQMGQLTASVLNDAGADVSMTLRKQFHGNSEESSATVQGCRMIAYDDRANSIESYQVVISATRSPHYTLRAAELESKRFQNVLWVDIALPRDIEPEIGNIDGIQLLDIDALGEYRSGDEKSYAEAEDILKEYASDFEQWYKFRRHVDIIKNISCLVKEDISTRTARSISQLDESEPVQDFAIDAAQKTVEKLLFGLKETLSDEQWQECLAALEQSALRDTIKT